MEQKHHTFGSEYDDNLSSNVLRFPTGPDSLKEPQKIHFRGHDMINRIGRN